MRLHPFPPNHRRKGDLEQELSGRRSRAGRLLVWPSIVSQKELLMKVLTAAPLVNRVQSYDLRPFPILTTCFADMKVQVKIPKDTRAMDVYL